MRYFSRGEVANIASINSETLRFYESNGLIPLPKRAANGYRQYPEDVLIQLEFIKNTKEAGFTLNQIKELFTLAESENINIDEITDAVNRTIKEVNIKMKNLRKLKKSLVEYKNEIPTDVCPYIDFYLKNYKKR